MNERQRRESLDNAMRRMTEASYLPYGPYGQNWGVGSREENAVSSTRSYDRDTVIEALIKRIEDTELDNKEKLEKATELIGEGSIREAISKLYDAETTQVAQLDGLRTKVRRFKALVGDTIELTDEEASSIFAEDGLD